MIGKITAKKKKKMKSNYLIVMLALLASGFMGCSDDDGDNWKKKFEDEQEK